MKEYKVYFHNFWPNFMTDEQNNVSFYKQLFDTESTCLVLKDKPEDADADKFVVVPTVIADGCVNVMV